MKKILVSLLALALSAGANSQSAIPVFRPGEVVALVGDSITHGGHYHSYIWLYYMTRFPDMQVTLLNCGVGGDTAGNMLERWDQDVAGRNPSYVTLTFGMNDTGYWGVYGVEKSDSLSAALVAQSLANYEGLVDKIDALPQDVKVVMIGGSPYDETSKFNDGILPGKNAAIQKIVAAQAETAARKGWGFVDFNAPMVEIADRVQALDPKYSFCPQDRVHPDKDGQMVMAYLFLKAQGLDGKRVALVDVDAKTGRAVSLDNCTVSAVKRAGDGISFDYLAKSLPYPCDSVAEHGWGNVHPQRNALSMVPFTEEFNQELLRVRGLPEGDYNLVIDSQKVAQFSAASLEKGINMATLTNTPQYRQACEVMYLNEERFDVEKRMREYIWLEYCMFHGTDQIFKDDWRSLEAVEKEAAHNWFVAMSGYWYKKSYYPEIRRVWQNYMDEIVKTIYTVNKPVTRRINIEKI